MKKFFSKLIGLLIVVTLLVSNIPISITTVCADSYNATLILDGYKDETFLDGEGVIAYVGAYTYSTYQRAVLTFDIPDVEGPITNATLRIYVEDINGVTDTPIVNLLKSSDAWSEVGAVLPSYVSTNYVTYNNGSSTHSDIPVTATGWLSFDVTDYLIEEYNNDKIITFVLTGREGAGIDSEFGFYTKENGSNAPQLTITTATAAPALTNGLSFSDPLGAHNNGKTTINLGAPSVGGNTFRYVISSDDNAVPTPEVGFDASSWIPVNNGDMISVVNGKHIGVAEVDGTNKVVQFSDSTAVVVDETADLTNLIISGSPANYIFDGGTYTYNSVTVANEISSITVTPTGAGTITVDGVNVASGTASNTIALTPGVEKTIEVVATEEGKTPKIYIIKITREIETIPPTIAGAVRNSDIQITVELSEPSENLTKANDGGFTVHELGNAGITYTVSQTAQGADNRHVVLTVANMGVSAKEGITVKYTAGANGTIADLAGNALATDSTGVNIAGWDTTAPTVSSIVRHNPATASTNATTVVYRITFSEAVTGVDTSDFTLTTTGTAAGVIASVSAASETAIDVTVNTITGTGTLRLDLNDSGTGIQDIGGNEIAAGYTAGELYTIDATAPTIAGAVRNSNTQITVELSEPCVNLTKANDGGFTVTKTGTIDTFAVTATAQDTDTSKIVLTVESTASAGADGLTVTYTAGGNGTIADIAGNQLATDSTGVVIVPWGTKLDTPGSLAWDGMISGKAIWSAVENASSYTIQLYKDGIAIGSPVTGITDTFYDFSADIAGAGSYTFTVQAIGNGATYADSDISSQSPGYTVRPSIDPAIHTYDLNAPADITATFTWHGATSVTDAVYIVSTDAVIYCALDPDDYNIDDDRLTIKRGFFESLSVTTGSVIEFVFTFNTGDDATLTVNVVDGFIPITAITGVPDTMIAGTPLALTGTVVPSNATNQTITWSVYNDGGTGASIRGNTLYTASEGIVTVRATITNGLTPTTDYMQDFNITVNTVPVTTYTITATAGSGGSIAPSGTVVVNEGGGQTFSITANSGYRISAVWVDGVNQGAMTSYTFAGVTADHTIRAEFTPTSSAESTPKSSGRGSSDTPRPPEKTITITEMRCNLFKDAKGSITVEANMDNAFSYSIELKITDTQEDAASFGLSAGYKVYPFDISLYIKGTNQKTKPAPGYAVMFSLPVPENLLDVKEQLVIMHKSESGVVTEIPSRLVQKSGVWYLVFETTEFSPYALVVRYAGRYDETVGVPYYLDSDGNKVFIGFAANGRYIAPEGVKVLVMQNGKSFTDINSHWAAGYIDFVAEREIFVGTGSVTFSPGIGMTRAMLATVIGKLYERSYGEIKTTGNKTFTDCNYDAYYGKYIVWASENGIITGYGNGRFGPDDQITREQMASILFRFADLLEVIPDSMDTVLGYPDADSISDYAKTAALYCQTTGIIAGRAGEVFAPEETATRAEAAAIIQKFVEVVLD